MKAIAIAIAILVATAGIAHAQDESTGGSMGGGDFSGGGGGESYSSGGSYSGGDFSPQYSSNDFSSNGGGGGGGAAGLGAMLAFVGVGLALGLFFARSMMRSEQYGAALAAARGTTDVTVLRVGLDAHARPFVQSELARIAASADTSTELGRARLLREVAMMLRKLRSAWVYGGAINEPLRPIAGAQAVFQRHVDDARARFTHELVRNEQGTITRGDAPAQHATTDDGPGVMLVSIVVAARHELCTVDLNRIIDGEQLRSALESLSVMVSGELVAVEIVWMPADPAQRLSSIALETAYPSPQLIRIAGAAVGKVFCEFCGAPYPAEAIACPECGGRAKGLAA